MIIAPLIRRRDLQRALDVSGETMRRWLASGRLPRPDVYVSDSASWWRLDTLQAAGFNVAAPPPAADPASANPPTPAAS